MVNQIPLGRSTLVPFGPLPGSTLYSSSVEAKNPFEIGRFRECSTPGTAPGSPVKDSGLLEEGACTPPLPVTYEDQTDYIISSIRGWDPVRGVLVSWASFWIPEDLVPAGLGAAVGRARKKFETKNKNN